MREEARVLEEEVEKMEQEEIDEDFESKADVDEDPEA